VQYAKAMSVGLIGIVAATVLLLVAKLVMGSLYWWFVTNEKH
jgi:hypothetical protein